MTKDVTVRKKKKRKKKNRLLRLLVLVVVCAGLYLAMTQGVFDIRKTVVSGNSYYTDEQVADKGGIRNGVNIFFDMSTRSAKKKLLKDPYIENAQVHRKLPATVSIKIEERKEAAAVVYGTSYFVIDSAGIVLRKTDTDPKVTLLSGIVIKTAEVGKPLEAEGNYVLTDTLKMIGNMEDSDIYFKKIEISSVMVKAYIYDQLYVRGTPEAMMENMENGNLQQVLYKQHEQGIERGVISVGSEGYCAFSAEIK